MNELVNNSGLKSRQQTISKVIIVGVSLCKEIHRGEVIEALFQYQSRRLKMARQIVQSGQGFTRSFGS